MFPAWLRALCKLQSREHFYSRDINPCQTGRHKCSTSFLHLSLKKMILATVEIDYSEL